jgi:hypothetical protein
MDGKTCRSSGSDSMGWEAGTKDGRAVPRFWNETDDTIPHHTCIDLNGKGLHPSFLQEGYIRDDKLWDQSAV